MVTIMDSARIALLERRRVEAVRGAAQAAVYIADGDLSEARKELLEAYHTINRMVAAAQEE